MTAAREFKLSRIFICNFCLGGKMVFMSRSWGYLTVTLVAMTLVAMAASAVPCSAAESSAAGGVAQVALRAGDASWSGDRFGIQPQDSGGGAVAKPEHFSRSVGHVIAGLSPAGATGR